MLSSLREPGEYTSTQWLCLAPLLALSTTLTMSLVAGMLNLLLLIILAVSVSMLRTLVPRRLFMPVLMLLLGTLACLMDMGMKYYCYELDLAFGLYLPLLAVNSLVYAISGDYFIRNGWRASLRCALKAATVILAWYIALGLFRELLGYGTLFRDFNLLGSAAAHWQTIHVIDGFAGIPLVHAPAGALLCCGLLAALVKLVFADDPAGNAAQSH